MSEAANKVRNGKGRPQRAVPARGAKNGKPPIRLTQALDVLRRHRTNLAAMGVLHAGIFGSLARGVAGAGSDVDVFDEARHLSVYDFVGIQHYLQDVLSKRVDVVERDAMKPAVRERALADAVDAF